MKTDIFSSAISSRNSIRFLYSLNEITIDPYYISREKNGKKVIYGKIRNSSEIKKFEFDKIVNIKVLGRDRFSPVIPILSVVN